MAENKYKAFHFHISDYESDNLATEKQSNIQEIDNWKSTLNGYKYYKLFLQNIIILYGKFCLGEMKPPHPPSFH